MDVPATGLDRQLGGDLPCVVCGYNLRGVSIRSVCPECGAAVRAAILAVVDPHASELRPIRWPRLVAAGLVVWAGCALMAAVVCWLPHIAEAWTLLAGRPVWVPRHETAVWAAALVLASGVGAVALVRPHDGLGWRSMALAGVGVAGYVPLAWVVWKMDAVAPKASVSYLRAWEPDPAHTAARLIMGGLIVLIAMALRPNARVLVARSLALRSGRVDRQTLLALAVAAIVAAAGDVLGLLSRMGGGAVSGMGGMRLGAIMLVAMGSALLTLGLGGALIDCWRIGRSIMRPGPTLGEMLAPEEHDHG